MSNRFSINGVQIFGNNSIGKHTYDECVRQGAVPDEDGLFHETSISDPDRLIQAICKDTQDQLSFAQTDSDALVSEIYPRELLNNIQGYDIDGHGPSNPMEIDESNWWYDVICGLRCYIDEHIVFQPLIAYNAIMKTCRHLSHDECIAKHSRLCIKDGQQLIVKFC